MNPLPAIENYIKQLGQPKGRTKQNGAVSQQTQNTVNSPIGDILTGKFSQVLPQITSDVSNFNKSLQPSAGGVNPTVIGMTGSVDAPGEDIPQNGGKYINENTDPLQGGTPAKVKAQTKPEVKFTYVPPKIDTDTTIPDQSNNVSQDQPLPNITSSQTDQPSATFNPPARPVQPKLKVNQKIAQRLNGLSNYQLPSSLGRQRIPLEQQDKSVMQNVIGGNTSQQVLERTNQASEKVWNKVENSASQHTAISTNTQILPYIKNRLDNLVNEGLITQAHADQALKGEATNLTQNGADITGDSQITGNQLVDLRKGANSVAPKQIPYNSANPLPYIRKAIAHGYSDAMGNLDPNINNLYQQYSSIQRIGEMPDSFRNQSLTMGKIPGTHVGLAFGSGTARRYLAALFNGDKAAGLSTLGVLGLAGVGTAAMIGGKSLENNLANTLGYEPKNQQSASQQPNNDNIGNNSKQHGYSMTQFDPNVNSVNDIPQSQTDLKQNPDGTYGIANIYSMKDQNQQPLFISPDQVKSQQLAIDQAKNTLLYKNSQPEQVRVGSLQDQLNTQEAFTKQIEKPYTTAQTKNSAYGQAILDAQAAGLDLANYNGTYDDFIKQISPKYADLATQLQTIEAEGAINPNNIIKGSTLLGSLQTAAKGNLMQFYATLNNVVGYTGGNQSVQTQTNAPQARNVPQGGSSVPAGFDFGSQIGGNQAGAAVALPPIQ